MNDFMISKPVYIVLKKMFKQLSNSFADNSAKLFLLGKDNLGICRNLVLLQRNGNAGCEFMPGVSSTEIARAMHILFKKKLTIAGFALVDCYDTKVAWSGDRGHDIYIHKLPFLIYRGDEIYSQRCEDSRKIITTPVSIVGKDFCNRISRHED